MLGGLLALTACHSQQQAATFPAAGRDVAPIVSDAFSTEDARDRVGEFEAVVAAAEVKRGMSVADIGAGEGYYTVRLSPLVGPQGRVLAQDIVPEVRDRLAERVQRERLDNVAVRLGEPADPRLPPASFDRIFLVHMYHEVTDPYAFLWHLSGGLKPGGEVIVVDADREVKRHGIPPAQLECEFGSIGLKLERFERLPGGDSFLAAFKAAGPRPAPAALKPCTKP
ncbi:class I SAM-dependent methyltransferase [Sphingomonas astaxanthinifaciens]|uniref:Methyltransferase type 11 n=1 Tax=Sphingomonas astaxanthinifaciens DSM 22298 TaxID=1123267 RepID=A0ABQ5Z9F8_9SPHN|nr:class I SAM-dependent methyltransferase [Sphingomonas astaxanthinifaciens]GLR47227.1 methyltransferase type 11 [Sphingomonas astaxanthinifaciens DSM 22298]